MSGDNLARHWIIRFPNEKSYQQFTENTDLTVKFKEIKAPTIEKDVYSVECNYGKRIWKKTVENMVEDYNAEVLLA